jgi:hypothetical protein
MRVLCTINYDNGVFFFSGKKGRSKKYSSPARNEQSISIVLFCHCLFLQSQNAITYTLLTMNNNNNNNKIPKIRLV